ncbi:MAG: ATP phosphoribosyltransferase regulatory subunit [Hyphomicrobiaceae bacterium]|nr:ATP phosphoribosyltransferase regulatory subunit [Hyphomicrobiaceae bacterium]
MAAETARRFQALEAQAGVIMSAFTAAGYEFVAPAIIQPAGVFLDVIGENLRARTYVFTDPEGEELCLRPDLTVPTCRLHMERHPSADVRARYCYNGPAFRFQPGGGSVVHPREFRQAGIESFAASDREKAEAEVVALIVSALKEAGLEQMKIRIGDLGLFRALLDAVDMPERWRRRLRHQFWRPEAFQQSLQALVDSPSHSAAGLPPELLGVIDSERPREAEEAVASYLANAGIELIGARTIAEIAENLLTAAADAKADPLPQAAADLIEAYVGVTAPPKAAWARLRDIMNERNVDISDALDTFRRRLDLLAQQGVEISHCEFSGDFGRSLEYYTGFVFEIVSPLLGPESPIAGGGRYDGLLRSVGAPHDVPAVGSAIHTERLLEAVTGESA